MSTLFSSRRVSISSWDTGNVLVSFIAQKDNTILMPLIDHSTVKISFFMANKHEITIAPADIQHVAQCVSGPAGRARLT